jgi:3,4-dihydroxy 2-butanone 4-phosphate synthase/GTP cyclohydrolase II
MVTNNRAPFGTAFTVSIEARRGVTNGISAADRATTILTAIDTASRPEDLVRPGHVFPLRAKKEGCWCGQDRPRVPWIWHVCQAHSCRSHL